MIEASVASRSITVVLPLGKWVFSANCHPAERGDNGSSTKGALRVTRWFEQAWRRPRMVRAYREGGSWP